MTSHAPPAPAPTLATRTAAPPRALPLPVLGLAMLTVLLRLPFLQAPMTPDEGGFLMVAHQWRPGPSLYGHYWVDRPPLLIALFRLADALGGLTPLRVIGGLAAAATVVGVGLAAGRASGQVAGTWAAAVAAALLVSPFSGATDTNGELLAAPFIAIGVWLVVAAVVDGRGRPAAAAGACAVAAVLVKQNMLDVIVFAVVLALVSWRTGRLRAVALRRVTGWFATGGLATLLAVLGLALLRGSSPGGVLFAMYQFRWRATTMAAHLSLAHRLARLHVLEVAELLTAGPLLLLALAVVMVLARRRADHPPVGLRSLGWVVAAATLALTAYVVVSVVAGGGYWLHYLVQLVVPTALAGGLLAAALERPGRALVTVVLLASSCAWAFGLVQRVPASGETVGTAVGRVSEPGDTMVSAFGDADILRTAGLGSPYPYLWSLPAHTLDPRFARLRSVLAGPRAPTWVVARSRATIGALHRHRLGGLLRREYHPVADICGRTVYLRDGVRRAVPPVPVGGCRRPLAPWLDAEPAGPV